MAKGIKALFVEWARTGHRSPGRTEFWAWLHAPKRVSAIYSVDDKWHIYEGDTELWTMPNPPTEAQLSELRAEDEILHVSYVGWFQHIDRDDAKQLIPCEPWKPRLAFARPPARTEWP